MAWYDWVLVACFGINIVLLCWNACQARLAYKLHERAIVLDSLLMRLCVDACQRDSAPVWKAWAQTMGTIEVAVSARRKEWNAPD
jgi:hypothetical protein